MKKRYTIKTLSILTMIIVGAVALSASQEGDNTETAASEAEVFEENHPVVRATGVTVPADWASLSFPLGGVIADIHVEEGELVEEGDGLVSLKGTEMARSAVDGAHLELVSAQQALNDLYEYAADTLLSLNKMQKTRNISGSTYKLLLMLTESVVTKDADLYASLQMTLPNITEIENLFLNKAASWVEMVKNRDKQKLIAKLHGLENDFKKENPDYDDTYINMYKVIEGL